MGTKVAGVLSCDEDGVLITAGGERLSVPRDAIQEFAGHLLVDIRPGRKPGQRIVALPERSYDKQVQVRR